MKSDTQRPMEKAIELLEYIVKTEGAEHLKIASRKHNIFLLYSVDVVCFCVVIFMFSYFFFDEKYKSATENFSITKHFLIFLQIKENVIMTVYIIAN